MVDDAASLRRGQLWWVYLDPVVGSEQAGRRPVVIVSADELLVGSTIVVVPLSTRIPEPLPAYMVRLPALRTSLVHDSVALCHQVRAVSRRRLVRAIGAQLPGEDMEAIAGSLRYVLSLEDAA